MSAFRGVGIAQTAQPKPGGEVIASDIILPASPVTSPPITDRITWTTDGTATGAVVAEVAGIEDGLSLDAIVMQVLDNLGGSGLAASFQAQFRLGFALCAANAGGTDAVIIDQSGQSAFLQLGGIELSTSGTGFVSWAGGTISNTTTLFLPGASGTVQGLAVGNDNGSAFVGVRYTVIPIGGGQCQVIGNVNPLTIAAGNSTGFTYAIWGN